MKTVSIICGGRSAEHEISLVSARNIVSAMDRLKYQPLPVVISRTGEWYQLSEPAFFQHTAEGELASLGELCTLIRTSEQTRLLTIAGKQMEIDVVFPLVHGPMGEDGTLQGYLELMRVPYVGSGVLSSAVGMDKDFFKQLLERNGLSVVPFITLHRGQSRPAFEEAKRLLASKSLFIKPAIMGSSVGITKVGTNAEYEDALEEAFRYSVKILIERYIPGRELECAVLGNTAPQASCVGEIIPQHEFYSYEAKYLDPDGARLVVPADLSFAVVQAVQRLAIQTFRLVECRGLARVDFFLTSDNTLYVNEINTIPGFTAISMYPKMWAASGIDYTALITRLIEYAEEEYVAKQTIRLLPKEVDVPAERMNIRSVS